MGRVFVTGRKFMTPRLHITNGDGVGNVLDACTIAGDVLPWRDPMHHGPFPAGLDLDAASPSG